MQSEFQSTPLCFLRSALRQAQNQEQTLELRLSEGMPDLGRILLTGGQARISTKQWRSDSVSLTGGIQAWALYLPADGSGPQLLEGWIPLQAKWSLPQPCREGVLDARITLRSMDGRVLSPRKLMLRASVALWAEALCPEETLVYSPKDIHQGVQLLENSYPVTLCREAGEKVFALEDTVSAQLPENLLVCRFTPRLTEQNVAGDQLILRGTLEARYLGLDGEGKLLAGQLELPFAQLCQLEGEYDKEATASVDLTFAAMDWQRTGEGLQLQCQLVAQYRIHGPCLLKLAQDAYSPHYALETHMENLTLPALLDSRRDSLELTQALQLPVREVVDTAFFPDEPVTYREADGLVAELPGQARLLYRDENDALQCHTEPVCGRWMLPAGEGCTLRLRVRTDGALPQVQNGQLQLQLSLEVEAETWTEQQFPMVTGLEVGQAVTADENRPSVVLRRAGQESLWDLAKGHGSSVEAICRANGLTGEPEQGRMLLIPVL